jgi:raffinose/stachyose/melibiose transport system substrate-binding protein
MMNVRSRTRGARVVAIGAALVLALAACAGDDDETSSTEADDTAAAATTSETGTTAASATTAASGGTETTAAGEDPLAGSSFTFLSVVTESGESAYKAMVDNYVAQYPERNIEFEEVTNATYGELLRTRFVGGNPPDVMYTTPGYGNNQALLSLAEAGYLEPLTGTAAEDTIDPAVRQNFELDGELYGQALNLTLVATVANTSAMEADSVTTPEDYAALVEACGPIAESGKSMYVVAAGVPANAGLFGLTVAGSRVYADNPEWNVQRAAGEVTFADTPGWTDTFNAIVEMNEAGCLQEGVVAGDFAAITNNLATGASYAAFIPGGAAFGLAAEAPDATFAVEAMPGTTAESTIIFASPNDALAVAKDADDEAKTAAKAFLEWLAVPENLAEAGSVQGWLPPVDVDPSALPPQFAPVADFLVEGDFVPLPSAGWKNPEVYNVFGVGIQGLLSGQTSAEAVLQQMDEAWDG